MRIETQFADVHSLRRSCRCNFTHEPLTRFIELRRRERRLETMNVSKVSFSSKRKKQFTVTQHVLRYRGKNRHMEGQKQALIRRSHFQVHQRC